MTIYQKYLINNIIKHMSFLARHITLSLSEASRTLTGSNPHAELGFLYGNLRRQGPPRPTMKSTGTFTCSLLALYFRRTRSFSAPEAFLISNF